MSTLEWNLPQDRIFEAGLDRGVLYPDEGAAVVWNGLTSVDDAGESSTKDFYLDGIKYLSTVSARDWKGSLSAYTYPDKFAELMGVVELGDGLFADSQMPGRFGLSYRTMVSAPQVDQEQHYKIHLVYNVMASMGSFTNKTLGSGSTDPNEFKFDLTAVPVIVPGHRPTAHFIIDTRKADPVALAEFEALIYGDADSDPAMPTVAELTSILNFADAVTIRYNGDGTWTATGSNENITLFDYGRTFRIDNVSATYLVPGEIYEFTEAVGDLTLSIDTDGIAYVDIGSHGVALLEDTDGIFYWDLGDTSIPIEEDTDGIYYIDSP